MCRDVRTFSCLSLTLLAAATGCAGPSRASGDGTAFRIEPIGPGRLCATGHDSRIDLRWAPAGDQALAGYHVYRSAHAAGPFAKLTPRAHRFNVYSDFIGANGRERFYRVTRVSKQGQESTPTETASARTRATGREELLTSVQLAAFRYFWDYGHPTSGLARETSDRWSANTCATGGTGMGLMAIVVAAERGFVSRAAAAQRTLRILRFLQERAERYHGAWAHWVDGATGKTRRFSKYDDGADLVETGFLVMGMLTSRQYFDGAGPVEAEIRQRATRMWREVQWDWFLRRPGSRVLYWHWSPVHGWRKNLPIVGYNEAMITYVLAVASPTHPIPPECYEHGWARSRRYVNGKTFYGYKQWVGPDRGRALFMTQYSFMGLDPRRWRDRYCNYFANSRHISLIHRAYAIENPKGFKGYGALLWGLSATNTPDGGYKAYGPGNDDGTVAVTAPLSAVPFTPAESLATLEHLYHDHGGRLWGPFGFWDAINVHRDWVSRKIIAIDQGPIICMIENHRTGLCWRLFMSNPEIEPALEAMDWRREPARPGAS